MSHQIEHRASFDFIRYANCWEDADILCDALPSGPGRRVLSIASGGDNSFALLAQGAEVVAADISQAQLACVELKCAAFRHLAYEAVLGFLGMAEDGKRKQTYQGLRSSLSSAARDFWDAHGADIEAGFVHAGKFEHYFHFFRTRIIPLVHSGRQVGRLLEEKTESERNEFYDRRWNNRRWRFLFKVFFSRLVMGRLGRDPEFFRYVEGSVADRILERTKYALTTLPTHANPFLTYILTGNFGLALPRYLRPEIFPGVCSGLDRLILFNGPAQEAATVHGAGGFDGYNLSDIFEYLDAEMGERVYGGLLDHARPGARYAYWNMLVPRSCPAAHAARIQSLGALSDGLFARDQAFFYSRFVVEEVRG